MRDSSKGLALAFIFLVSAGALSFGGGGSQQPSSPEGNSAPAGNGLRLTDKPVTLSYWVTLSSNAPIQTMNDMGMYQEMEKITGVHINFFHPPAGQQNEQFNLMIASRDLPDIIEYTWGSYPGGVDKAITDNVIVNLTGKIKTLAPDYYAAVTKYPDVEKQVKTDRGNFYAFQAIGIGVNAVTAGLIIREDWRRELGLPMPETVDEIAAMLTRFKNEKGATAPYTGGSTIFNEPYIAGAFGVGTGYFMVNQGKTVKYGPLEPAFRDYLTLMHDWYVKGLLDPDFIANDRKAMDAKVTSGKAGMVSGGLGGGIGTYLNAMKDKGTSFDLTGIKSPALKKGDVSNFGSLTRDMRPNGMAAIMTPCKEQDLAMRWFNIFYTETGNNLRNFGVEGLTYTWVNGYPKYTDLVMKNPEGLSMAAALLKYSRAAEPAPGLIDQRYADQYTFQFDQQKAAAANWTSNLDRLKVTMMVPVTFTPEEASSLGSTSSNINTYVAEMLPKFIMGTEDLSKFNDFVSQLRRLGIENEIKIRQTALDRYNAR
jgi:putative aldouronate transport system substrate-binding protein